jgi:hypothetical protein
VSSGRIRLATFNDASDTLRNIFGAGGCLLKRDQPGFKKFLRGLMAFVRGRVHGFHGDVTMYVSFDCSRQIRRADFALNGCSVWRAAVLDNLGMLIYPFIRKYV